LALIETELVRLTAAIVAGGSLDTIIAAVKEREARRQALRAQLAAIDGRAVLAGTGRASLEDRARAIAADWRALLARKIPQARQIVSKLLDGRFSVVPERREGVKGFRLTGAGSFLKFFAEIPEISLQPLVSPTGHQWLQHPEMWQPIQCWLAA
jgi:hypothetical protein